MPAGDGIQRANCELQRPDLLHVAMLYAAALVSGYLMSLLRVPLPWMIGPMALAATVSLAGKIPTIPWITRPIGQMVVAASVGLFFTPAALAVVSQQIVLMIAVAVLTIAAGFLAALVLVRLAKIDVVSASLASIPGGPVEMAALAARHGADSGTVAFAQILRIGLLVLIIPPLLVAIDGEVADPSAALAGGPVDHLGAILLLAIAFGGGQLLTAAVLFFNDGTGWVERVRDPQALVFESRITGFRDGPVVSYGDRSCAIRFVDGSEIQCSAASSRIAHVFTLDSGLAYAVYDDRVLYYDGTFWRQLGDPLRQLIGARPRGRRRGLV
jgi:membrane AbrB-like protein